MFCQSVWVQDSTLTATKGLGGQNGSHTVGQIKGA